MGGISLSVLLFTPSNEEKVSSPPGGGEGSYSPSSPPVTQANQAHLLTKASTHFQADINATFVYGQVFGRLCISVGFGGRGG